MLDRQVNLEIWPLQQRAVSLARSADVVSRRERDGIDVSAYPFARMIICCCFSMATRVGPCAFVHLVCADAESNCRLSQLGVKRTVRVRKGLNFAFGRHGTTG